MDKIYLNNLEIFAYHGVFEEEKKLGQKFILSLELNLDLREAGVTGDLTKSVHYGELCHGVEKVFTKQSYDLIEMAAEKVAEFVLTEYPLVQGVKVTLKKPWAPIMRHLEYAAIEINRKWHKAFISFGSNMGDKEANINNAIELIKKSNHTKVVKVSSFIKTEPWGYVDQEEFINGAMEIRTMLSPIELVEFLLSVEQELKRERIIKWGPRTIDLDVILYDDVISTDERIILPHPRMEQRLFVLEPLAEIAPYEVHPIFRRRIIDLKEDVEK